MKVILEMEKPKDCERCQLCNRISGYKRNLDVELEDAIVCVALDREIRPTMCYREKDCPLIVI